LFFIFFLPGQNSEAIKTIDAKAFAEKSNNTKTTNSGCASDEFSSDHIENAKNINWLGVLLFRCRKMDKSVPVLYILQK
jgi:hypothetical protein